MPYSSTVFKRIGTAIIGIPTAILLIYYGGWPFFAAIFFLALSGWLEYCQMIRPQFHAFVFLGGIFLALLLACAWWGNSQELLFVSVTGLLCLIIRTIFSFPKISIIDLAIGFFGYSYVGLFVYLLFLRLSNGMPSESITLLSLTFPAGAAWVLYAFIGTWANDTFAYAVGMLWGRHKMIPLVSPGKTWEGTMGGCIGTMMVSAALGPLLLLPFIHTLILGFLIFIAATVGDLAESALKRFCSVKDSGSLLPGHGGVLDRFDSILFVAPIVYYYISIFL